MPVCRAMFRPRRSSWRALSLLGIARPPLPMRVPIPPSRGNFRESLVGESDGLAVCGLRPDGLDPNRVVSVDSTVYAERPE